MPRIYAALLENNQFDGGWMKFLLSLLLILLLELILFLFFTFTCLAQNNDQRLAYQYFVDGDYEKAIVLYEEINKKRFSINTNPYYTSLINLNKIF